MNRLFFKKLFLLLLVLSVALPLSAETKIDGYEILNGYYSIYYGLSADPSVSSSQNARIYYNYVDDKLYISKAGAAYAELGSGGAGGSGTMTTVKASGSQVGGADIVTLDFGQVFNISEDPNTEINIDINSDGIKDYHIDFGTNDTEVSAADIPIADAGGLITGTEVETALQENRTAIDLNTAKTTESTTVADTSTIDMTLTGTEIKADLLEDGAEAILDLEDLQGQLSASRVSVLEIGSATYDDIQDWINTTQSAGKISGGAITDNGDGTATVAAGIGFIKTTDSDTGVSKYFDWSQDVSVSLTDNDTNYIYVEYNAGSPQITSSTTIPSDKNTNIMLGLAYREGTTLHITSAGQIIANFAKKVTWKDIEINGKFQRASGIMIGETGTRNITITSGKMYAGFTEVSLAAFDSSGADTFVYYYRDGAGGWTKVTAQSQIDNTQYDDGDGTLGTLSDGGFWGQKNYGVHWVYMDADGDVFVIYGQGDYTLSEANSAQPLSSIPDLLADIGGLIGKIIIQKDASSFTSVQSYFNQKFSPSAVANHNDLTGVQGGSSDEYYHLDNSDYTELTGWLDDVTLGSDGKTTSPEDFVFQGSDAAVCKGFFLEANDGGLDFKMGFVGGTSDERVDVGWNEPSDAGPYISFFSTNSTSQSSLELVYGTDAASEGMYRILHHYNDGSEKYGEVFRIDADGDIHLNPDVIGDVFLFDDNDVSDTTDGKGFSVYRKAAEGDNFLKMFVDQYQGGYLWADTDYLWLEAKTHNTTDGIVATKDNFYVGHEWIADGDVPAFRLHAYPTGESMTYLQWKLNDTTDEFEVTRESTEVEALRYKLPVTLENLNDIIIIDGTTYAKSSTGLQAAHDALPATGGRILCPDGEYDMTGLVTITKPVWFEGIGGGTAQDFMAGYNVPQCTYFKLADSANSGMFLFDTADGDHGTGGGFRNIGFDGNKDNNACTTDMISFEDWSDFYIEDCFFYNQDNATYSAIETDSNCWGIWFLNNQFEECDGIALELNGHRYWVRDCHFRDDLKGVYFANNGIEIGLSVSNSDFRNMGQEAIDLYGGTITFINNVHIFDAGNDTANTYDAIYVDNSSQLVYMNNLYVNGNSNTRYAVGVNSGSYVYVNNTAVANTVSGTHAVTAGQNEFGCFSFRQLANGNERVSYVDGGYCEAIRDEDSDIATDTWLFELTHDDADDTEAHFIRCRDDNDGTPDTKFEVKYDGSVDTDGYLKGENTLGQIKGLVCSYSDADTVSISAGYAECNGNIYFQSSATTHDITSGAAGEQVYIYIDDSASSQNSITYRSEDKGAEVYAWSESKQGYYSTTNTDDRFIGAVYCSGVTTILFFTTVDMGHSVEVKIDDELLGANAMNPSFSWQTPDTLESDACTPISATHLLVRGSFRDGDSAVTGYITNKENADQATSVNDEAEYFFSGANSTVTLTQNVRLGSSRKVRVTGTDINENQMYLLYKGWTYSR